MDPGLDKVSSTISTPLMEHSTIQSSSSSLSGRTVVHLPANVKYRRGWEILGVKWLESLDGEPFLAKALLPEGWTTKRGSTLYLYSDYSDIRIIDSSGQEQVKMQIRTNTYQQATVSFLKIGKKLLEQVDKKEAAAIKDDFKPVCYPGYYSKFYCSYDEVVSAIESWGKVEAILMCDSGLNHTFIVSFKKPIKFSSSRKGVKVDLEGGSGMWHTPFSLRGMYRGSSSCSNAILSNNLIAFDICCLSTGQFSALNLWESRRLVPDKQLSQIEEEFAEHQNWKDTEKRIDSTFSESDRAKKLLEWIKQSGLSILEKGLYVSHDSFIGEYPVDEIIANYTSGRSASPWKIVMKAKK